jgi:hypothetical protein
LLKVKFSKRKGFRLFLEKFKAVFRKYYYSFGEVP